MKLKTLCFALAFAVAAAGSASASVVTTIGGAQVNRVHQGDSATVYTGLAFHNVWGHQDTSIQENVLAEWDVSAVTGQTLQSAMLRLYVNDAPALFGTTVVDIHEVTQAWDSSTTWDTYDGTNNWVAAGGDVAAAVAASSASIATAAGPALVGTWVDFDVTSLVQGWADGSIANNGVRVSIADTPSAYGNFNLIASGSNGPQLVVTAVPEPASCAALLGLGVGAFVLRRKRKRS